MKNMLIFMVKKNRFFTIVDEDYKKHLNQNGRI